MTAGSLTPSPSPTRVASIFMKTGMFSSTNSPLPAFSFAVRFHSFLGILLFLVTSYSSPQSNQINDIVYTFEVATSSLTYADSAYGNEIFFILHGSLLSSSQFTLGSSYNLGVTESFEKSFEVLGELDCLEVSTTAGDRWFFDFIKVTYRDASRTFENGGIFLDADDANESIIKAAFTFCCKCFSIFLSFPPFCFKPFLISLPFLFQVANYIFEVKTSDPNEAGSILGNEIQFILHGRLQSSSSFTLGETYSSGDLQIVEKTLNDIGPPHCLEVLTNSKDSWLFDYITVTYMGVSKTFQNGEIALGSTTVPGFVARTSSNFCGIILPFLSFPFFFFPSFFWETSFLDLFHAANSLPIPCEYLFLVFLGKQRR